MGEVQEGLKKVFSNLQDIYSAVGYNAHHDLVLARVLHKLELIIYEEERFNYRHQIETIEKETEEWNSTKIDE